MKVYSNNTSIEDFNAWSGAKDTKETIINEGKTEEFNQLINDLYPEGIEETQLNDIMWHDTDWVYEMLGIEEE